MLQEIAGYTCSLSRFLTVSMVLVTAFAKGLILELSDSLLRILLPAARHWKVSAELQNLLSAVINSSTKYILLVQQEKSRFSKVQIM